MSVVPEPVVTGLEPRRVLPGSRLWIRGEGFPRPDASAGDVAVGGLPARVSFASPTRVAVVVPDDLPGGPTAVKLRWAPGATFYAEVGRVAATGVHMVDSPAWDAAGRLYLTCSGARGQESAVSVYRVSVDGAREPFATGIVNATSLAVGPDQRVYVSSRFDGAVYRLAEDGTAETVATDLGVACGLAFAPDGTLYVGDRTGTIHRVAEGGHVSKFASLPASVAAFHLAFGPDGALYATAPTLATRDAVYRLDAEGRAATITHAFGRPQGLAFDADGVLHVVEALAGASGVYRVEAGGRRELAVTGPGLVGLAFGPGGRLAVASADTAYCFD
jgi:sugar lactone lactonase YvrE